MRTTLLRIALHALLALTLASCSVVRLAYYHVDSWLLGQVESFVTLNAEQRGWLEERLRSHREWHCQIQLPAYIQWLGGLQAEVDTPEPARLEALAQRLDEFIEAILVEFAPTIAELLLRLEPGQRAELFARLDQELVDTRMKYLDPLPEQRQRERAERLEKRLRPWIGAPTVEQSARIRQWSMALDDQNSGWLANRQRLLEAVQETLTGPDVDSARRQLVGLFETPATVHTADYARQVVRTRTEGLALVMDLLRSTTDLQRTRFGQRIEGLRADFQALSCGESITVSRF
ncbi:MAG: DUF6279 family lipoprotein [Candidatus Competibacteraceae bacterium]|jgi:hypothetical protein